MRRIGIIGLGNMGRIHAENIFSRIDNAQVELVFDPNATVAKELSDLYGARIASSSDALISDSDVDAVLIASPADLHFSQVQRAIEVGKPVFVEKPLLTNPEDETLARGLAAATAANLVWVGFMRRFDPSFLELKRALKTGVIGEAVFLEMSHRNPAVPDAFDDVSYMLETFIHECDVVKWLLKDDVASVQVDALGPQKTGTSRHDPIFATLFMRSGTPIRLTGHIDNSYGYQIRCEIIGREGEIALDDSLWHGTDSASKPNNQAANWGLRFSQAYLNIITSWVSDLESGRHTGVTMQAGIDASRAAWALVEAVKNPGVRIQVRYS